MKRAGVCISQKGSGTVGGCTKVTSSVMGSYATKSTFEGIGEPSSCAPEVTIVLLKQQTCQIRVLGKIKISFSEISF